MKSSRTLIVGIAIAALVAAGVLRDVSIRQRQSAGALTGRTGVASLNSYALALLLGGLRGPLVMALWASSESQKTSQDLEDFDTKVEWIRLLQPEFDSVHMFQMWNKAYNVSVQMASLTNKYTTILDAIEYGRKVDQERPNNINIIYALATTYAQKLGDSAEKNYFRRRVRQETLPHELVRRGQRGDPGWRPLTLDPMLDADGNILPPLLAPNPIKVARLTGQPDVPATQPVDITPNDGSELQYLAPYQPFRYGLSPQALGYNYFRQAQSLQQLGKQKHAQLGGIVIDSRPAITQRLWAMEEWNRGRRAEARAMGLQPQSDPLLLASQTDPAGEILPDRGGDVAEAVDAYALAQRLMSDSTAAYLIHHERHPENRNIHRSHLDEMAAHMAFLAADEAYLRMRTATDPAERSRLAEVARGKYQQAIEAYRRIVLRYYISDAVVRDSFPRGLDRTTVDRIPASELARVIETANKLAEDLPGGNPFVGPREEYGSYISRIDARLTALAGK